MIMPNFFIVGAPRCGTTSLYQYLKRHPQIFMSEIKEPQFFAKDLYTNDWPAIRSLEDYRALFTRNENASAIGEASTWHLYSKSAALEITKVCPEARIIMVLRNPVDMIYSLHARWVYRGIEDIEDFAKALEAEHDRKRGHNLPPNLKIHPKRLLYSQVAKFSEQVARYLHVFGRDRVHVIIFDDFQADTKSVYVGILRFLNLNTEYLPEFRVFNRNKIAWSQTISSMINSPPKWTIQLARSALPFNIRCRIGPWLTRINTRYMAREPMQRELRQDLLRTFAPEVEKLSILIGRDLSSWNAAQ